MTEFEFIFALYALLLGLSLATLIGGLGNVLERKFADDSAGGPFRIGWLSPLMAVFVLLDLLSFWMFAWAIRTLVGVDAPTLLGVALFASSYYLAARLVFPADPGRFIDLDTHYFRVHRTILAILVGLVAVQWAYLLSIEQLRPVLMTPLSVGVTAVFLVLMGAAMIFRTRPAQIALLALLIARYMALYLFL